MWHTVYYGVCIYWDRREFQDIQSRLRWREMATSIIFWSKIPTFFNLCFIRSALLLRSFSCQNYGRRWTCVGGNGEKLIKNGDKLQFVYDVILWVSLMSHTSFESPQSEVCYIKFLKCGDHVVALYSKMNKNLKMALERHLVDQFWWHIP